MNKTYVDCVMYIIGLDFLLEIEVISIDSKKKRSKQFYRIYSRLWKSKTYRKSILKRPD